MLLNKFGIADVKGIGLRKITGFNQYLNLAVELGCTQEGIPDCPGINSFLSKAARASAGEAKWLESLTSLSRLFPEFWPEVHGHLNLLHRDPFSFQLLNRLDVTVFRHDHGQRVSSHFSKAT